MLSKSKNISFFIIAIIFFMSGLFFFESSLYAQTQKYILNLSVKPKIIKGDGSDEATMTAKVTNFKKIPVSGVTVLFSIISGEGTLSEESATTDDDGIATTSLTSTTAGNLYVRANIEDARLRGKRVVRIRITKSPTTSTFNLTLSAEPTSIQADGESASTIKALLRNNVNNPVVGVPVTFETTQGIITGFAVTDTSGIATATLTSDTTAGTVTITAKYKGTSKTTTVEFTEITESVTMTVKANPKTIQADGASTSTITVLLRNSKNNPVQGATVSFEADHGVIPSSAVTNSSGVATVALTSDDFNGDVTVIAKYNDIEKPVTVKFVVAGLFKLSLSLSTNTIPSDGTTATITAILTDSANNPIVGKTVKFSNALDVDGDGTISAGDTLDYATLSASTGTTDSDGKVTGITVTSSNTGTVVIKAEVDEVVDNEILKIVAPSEVKSVAVTTDDTKILVGGETTTITATFQNVPSGTATFTTTLGYFTSSTVIPIDVVINSGIATATLASGNKTGVAEIKVSALVDATTGERIEGSVFVKISANTAATIELSSSPNNIPINVGESTITARVRDASGNPVSGVLVGFEIVNSPGGTGPNDTSQLSAASAITDDDGIATVTFIAGALETPTFNGVRIDAFLTDDTSIKDTTYLTISGKPSFISITYSEAPTINEDDSLSVPVTALVSDIHGNPVADGTPVSLGLVITRLARAGDGAVIGDFSGSEILNSEDINQNSALDSGEDINNNGFLDFIEDVNGNGLLDDGEDLDGNNKLNRSETLEEVGVLITPASATTENGVAKAELKYGQSLMEKYQVLITAEAGGVINSQYLVLPHTLREIHIEGTTDKTKLVPTDQTAFIVSDTTNNAIPPAGPTELTAILISAGRVSLDWTDNSNNETGFEIERSTTSGSGFVQIADSSDVGPNTTSFIDSTASVGTIYFYRVRAVNTNGNSSYSNEASTLAVKINPPSSLAAYGASSNQVLLVWTDNSDNESGFIIEKASFDGTFINAFEEIAKVGKDVTYYRDGKISPAFTYFYRVKAFSETDASLYSNEVSHRLAAFAPSNLIATVFSATQNDLTWNDNSSNETGFEIERSESFWSGFAKIGTNTANDTTYSDTTAVANTTYYYRVRATTSGGGVSGYSNVISPTGPTINPPSGLVATGYYSAGPPVVRGTTLTWTDNSTNEVGFVIEEKTLNSPYYTETLWVPATLPASGTGAMTITVVGLSEASQHFYRIRAFNGSTVSDYSNEDGAVVP